MISVITNRISIIFQQLSPYLLFLPCFSVFWGQGEEGVGKRSVLDMDPEVQAIMEMTGKTLHSQGLREPEEDQDE